ncbi:MAG TPA: hypothetical protein VLL77_14325 [Anaerolineales bacterium]|nr:hypothetical protein [Anaerolineales bacterium]
MLSLIRRPRRVAYVPSALAVVPWIELAFGWAIDRLGPIALRRQVRPVDARSDQNKLW